MAVSGPFSFAPTREKRNADMETTIARQYDWLDSKHPVWEAGMKGAAVAGGEFSRAHGVRQSKEIGPWLRNERRLRGGDDALAELARFDWESGELGDVRYRARQAQATYINFPEMLVNAIVGHLSREAPTPEKGLTFGGLGHVRRAEERDPSRPTRAEMLYFNCDGVGNDGSQWPNFWTGVAKRAMATGHRWLFVESGAKPPKNGVQATEDDELAGRRPYLVEFGPDKVINWHHEEGRLAFAVVRVPDRSPRLVDGKLVGNAFTQGYYLMVRRGFQGFGEAFAQGGWWLFDHERKPITVAGPDGQPKPRMGTWEHTGGEIPLVLVPYERDTGSEERPAISRSAITELGQIAVSYMNLSSGADFDAWEASSSVQVVVGADPAGFNLMAEKMAEGNRIVPLPSPQTDPEKIPQIFDASTGAVVADVFKARLTQKLEEARLTALQEASGTPDSSGESKRAGFKEHTAPKLAAFAAELENAMNSVLYFAERRWGITSPSAECQWPREFDLTPLLDDIGLIFDLVERAGVRSATLAAELVMRAVREKRAITDEAVLQKVGTEIRKAVEARAEAEGQQRALDGDVAEILGRRAPGAAAA